MHSRVLSPILNFEKKKRQKIKNRNPSTMDPGINLLRGTLYRIYEIISHIPAYVKDLLLSNELAY